MRLQNFRAPLTKFSADFYDVFFQVIELRHFYTAANQDIFKLFTRRIIAASLDHKN